MGYLAQPPGNLEIENTSGAAPFSLKLLRMRRSTSHCHPIRGPFTQGHETRAFRPEGRVSGRFVEAMAWMSVINCIK